MLALRKIVLIGSLAALGALVGSGAASAQEGPYRRDYRALYMDAAPVYGRWHDRTAFPRTNNNYPMTENAGPSTATGGPSGGIN